MRWWRRSRSTSSSSPLIEESSRAELARGEGGGTREARVGSRPRWVGKPICMPQARKARVWVRGGFRTMHACKQAARESSARHSRPTAAGEGSRLVIEPSGSDVPLDQVRGVLPRQSLPPGHRLGSHPGPSRVGAHRLREGLVSRRGGDAPGLDGPDDPGIGPEVPEGGGGRHPLAPLA